MIFTLTQRLLGAVVPFWRWWTGEILACLPDSAHQWLATRRPIALIRPQFNQVYIELIDRHEVKRLSDERPLETLDDAAWEQLGEIIRTRRATIILDHPHAFVTSLPLPATGLNFAERMIDLQLERLSPISPDKIYWNWTLAQEGENHVARIAMVRRDEIARIDQLLCEHSIQMPAIAAACNPAPVPLLNGFDGTDTQERRKDLRYYLLALTVLTVTPFLALACLTLARLQTAAEISTLEETVGPKIRSQARFRAITQAELVLQPIVSRPAATDIVRSLATSLPDDAILRSLVMEENGQVQLKISGASAQEIQSALADEFQSVTAYTDEISINEAQSPSANFPNISNRPLLIVEIRP